MRVDDVGDTRVERHLGWVTVNGQRYPQEKAADWLDAIRKQICPFCGEGPFTVVAGHVARRHGIDRHELRDLLGLTADETICDPYHSAERRETGRRFAADRDMAAMAARRSGKRRMTTADAAAHARQRKPRACVVCGAQCPSRNRATCSDACQKQRQSEAAKETRARHPAPPAEMLRFTCPVCGEEAEKPAAQVRANRKAGWAGPFCGMSCAGKYRQAKRYGGSA